MEGILPNLVHEVSVTLIPKPVRDIIRKKTENLYLLWKKINKLNLIM